MKVYKKHNKVEGKMDIGWMLATHCEKACPYCIAKNQIKFKVDGSKFYSDETLEKQDKVFDVLMNLTNANIAIFGGEPSTHPKGIEYFDTLCSNYRDDSSVQIQMLSHGDLSHEQIDRIKTHKSELPNHTIVITYHPKQVLFEEWFLKIKALHDKLNIIVLFILNDNLDQLYKDYKAVQDAGILTEAKGFIKKDYSIKTSQEVIDRFMPLFKQSVIDARQSNVPQSNVSLTEDSLIKVFEFYEILDGFHPNDRTLCAVKSFLIDENHQLMIGCPMKCQVQSIDILNEPEKIEKFLEGTLIKCNVSTCSEVHSSSNVVTIR